MICGALQTLNEEAFEDVASSERPSPSGLPTGEMLAAQLQLAPIRESSEFGSPSDEHKINNILQYATNNNYNNLNNHKQHLHQNHNINNSEYMRSASTHSLQSLGGGLQMGNGGNGSSSNIGGFGSSKEIDMYNIRHSLVGDSSTTAAVHLLVAAKSYQRHHSVGDELLNEPVTPLARSPVPTVVVIPNANGSNGVDDTKL